MERRETVLRDGWLFALGTAERAPEDGYEAVSVPHDWIAGRGVSGPGEHTFRELSQGFFGRGGVGWYRRTFAVEGLRDGESVRLCFGGVYEDCTVWVNGVEAGRQRYGYTSFELDVTGAVREGSNELLVRVDDTKEPVDRWYCGCGIYRPVRLVRMAKRHIDLRKVSVRTELKGRDAAVSVLTGTEETVQAELALPDGRRIGAEGRGTLRLEVPGAPLWSAERPRLCVLTLSLTADGHEEDSCSMRVGLRQVRFDDHGMTVNGERTVLRGVCLHQDFAPVGLAVTPELWRARLLQLKELGCNAIRAAHHLYASEFMDLCDELGFYVYEECFDKWHSGLYGRYFDEDWRHDLDAMICRDRCRPSVVIWGVGNEVEDQALPRMLDTLRMLVSRAHELDASRPVTYAMNPHFKRPARVDLSRVKDIQAYVDEADDREITDADERVERIRLIAGIVDIIACNYQEQWYDLIHAAVPEKPVVGTETYQYFMGHRDSMQDYVERLPALVPEKTDYVIGGFIWTGFDYLGESMGWPSKGWTGSVFRTNGVPRASYYLLKAVWSKEPVLRVLLLDQTLPDEFTKEHWSVPPYEDHWDFPQVGRAAIPLLAATNCEKVTIEYGAKVLILDELHRDANGMLRGFIPYVPGRLVAHGYIGGREVISYTLKTPGPVAKLAFAGTGSAAPGEKLLLTVQAQDIDGTPSLRAEGVVRFSARGAGRIVATDNGDLNCHVPYASHEMPLFRGRVSVLVEKTEDAPLEIVAEMERAESARTVC